MPIRPADAPSSLGEGTVPIDLLQQLGAAFANRKTTVMLDPELSAQCKRACAGQTG